MSITVYEPDPRCCAEVGSIKTGWHACNRPAVVFTDHQHGTGGEYRLFYCKRHEARATSRKGQVPTMRIVRFGRVEASS